MAKNAVTDWSATDSLNTDIGSTNIAEGCAPGGINDAIRKVMAQVASFIANAVFGNVAINGTLAVTAPTTILTDAQFPKVDFVRSGVGTWRLGGSGTAGDTSFNVVLNGGTPSVTFDTSGSAKVATNFETVGGALRVNGTSAFGSAGDGLELHYSAGVATIQAVNRTGGGYRSLRLTGDDLQLLPQGASKSISATGNIAAAGTLALGGAALGGVSGVVQFNTSAGSANVANISWQSGNEFRIANVTNGSVTTYVNGASRFSVTNTLVSSPVPIYSSTAVRAGLATVGGGAVQIAQGTASLSGYLEFLDTAGSSIGAIQQTIGGPITHVNSGGGGHWFSGGNIIAASGALITGAVNPTGAGARIEYSAGTALFGAFDYGAGILKATDVNGSIIRLRTGAAGTASTRLTIANTAITSAVPLSVAGGITSDSIVDGTTSGFLTTGGVRSRASASGPAILQFTDNGASSELGHIRTDGTKITFHVGGVDVLSIDSSGVLRVLGSVSTPAAP